MARKPYVYACGVEKDFCSGTLAKTNHGLGVPSNTIRAHASPEEAFRCARKALIAQGWEQLSSREYRPAGGGAIRVLTKQSRFGGRLRNGKEGTRNMPARNGSGLLYTC